MLKNRSINLKMVKDNCKDVDNPPIDYNKIATVITKNVATLLVVYIGADALRKAFIYTVSARI